MLVFALMLKCEDSYYGHFVAALYNSAESAYKYVIKYGNQYGEFEIELWEIND